MISQPDASAVGTFFNMFWEHAPSHWNRPLSQQQNVTEKHHRQKWGGRGEAEEAHSGILEVSTSLHGSSAGIFHILDYSNSPKLFWSQTTPIRNFLSPPHSSQLFRLLIPGSSCLCHLCISAPHLPASSHGWLGPTTSCRGESPACQHHEPCS